MLAGMLAGSGYYSGEDPLVFPTERETNPKGVFEDRQIVSINEAVLASVMRTPPTRVGRQVGYWIGRFSPRWAPGPGMRWAAILPPGTRLECTPEVRERIVAHVSNGPFCFKDPRFCYTLPAWRPHVGDAVFLCIFREPGRTAQSMVTEWNGQPGRRRMSLSRSFEIWRAMYRNVLEHRREGEWLFVHYDQLLEGPGADRIERALGVNVDRSFPERRLKRSPDRAVVEREDAVVYRELCDLAGFDATGGTSSS